MNLPSDDNDGDDASEDDRHASSTNIEPEDTRSKKEVEDAERDARSAEAALDPHNAARGVIQEISIGSAIIGNQNVAQYVKVPLEYEVWGDGVYKRKDPSTYDPATWSHPTLEAPCPHKHRSRLDQISTRPVYVQRSGYKKEWKRADPDRLVELAWRKLDGELEIWWVTADVISQRKLLVALSRYDCPATDVNAPALVTFLNHMRDENLARAISIPYMMGNQLVMPVVKPIAVVAKTSYYEHGGQPCYLVGEQWIGPTEAVCVDKRAMRDLQRAYGPSKKDATEEERLAGAREWISFVKKYMFEIDPANSRFVRWMMGVSFTAPMLPITDERTFIVHVYANRGSSKTAVATLAMSGWGDPSGLKLTFNTTAVAFLATLEHEVSHVPVLYDELQMAGNLDTSVLAYAVSNESGRSRADTSGMKTNIDVKFQSVIITTGEQSFISRAQQKDMGGVAGRVLELYLDKKTALPEELGRDIYRFYNQRRQWGWIAPEFLRRWQDAINTPEKRLEQKIMLTKMNAEILARGVHQDVLSRMGVVAFAEFWFLKEFFVDKKLTLDERATIAWNQAVEDAVKIYENTVQLERSQTGQILWERALDAIADDRATFPGRYPDLGTVDGLNIAKSPNVHQGITAWIHDGEIVFSKAKLEKLLNEHNAPFSRTWQDLRDADYAVTEPGHLEVGRQKKGLIPAKRYPVLKLEALHHAVRNSPIMDEPGPQFISATPAEDFTVHGLSLTLFEPEADDAPLPEPDCDEPVKPSAEAVDIRLDLVRHIEEDGTKCAE